VLVVQQIEDGLLVAAERDHQVTGGSVMLLHGGDHLGSKRPEFKNRGTPQERQNWLLLRLAVPQLVQ
jgi:hypothetical protein